MGDVTDSLDMDSKTKRNKRNIITAFKAHLKD
jgi:hypothetical protein